MKINYRADIDGLRAFAVLIVIFFHYGVKTISGGFIGVDIFFVISGYLITSIIYFDIQKGDFSYKEFYARRIKRLLPPYIVVSLVTTIAAFSLLLPNDLEYYAASLGSSYVGMSNVFFSMLSGGYFSIRTASFPLLHSWSLSVEEQYYIFWPFLFILSYRVLNNRHVLTHLSHPVFKNKLILLWMIGLISFTVLSIYGAKTNPTDAYYLIQYRAFELLVGSVLALSWSQLPTMPSIFNHLCSVLAMAILIWLSLNLSKQSTFPGANALYVCLATALLIYTGKGSGGIVNKILSLKPIVGIGLISYSLYLWHWPILSLARYRQIEITPPVMLSAITLVFLLSWLSWRLIENPIRKNKLLTFRPIFLYYYVMPTSISIIFGIIVFSYNGIPHRYDKDFQQLVSSYSTEKDLLRKCSTRPLDFNQANLFYKHLVDNCSFGELKNSSPGILLLGDSHANHFKPFIDVLAKNIHLRAVYHVQGGCAAIVGIGDVNDHSNCAIHNRILLSHADKFDYVVLGGAWASTRNQSLEQFKIQLETSIKKIISMGARPVIFIDSPFSKKDVSKCPIFSHLGWVKDDCNIPFEEVKKVQLDYDEIIYNTSKMYPELIIINPKLLMCDDKSCPLAIDNLAIYRDSSHINKLASTMLGEKWISKYGNPFTHKNKTYRTDINLGKNKEHPLKNE